MPGSGFDPAPFCAPPREYFGPSGLVSSAVVAILLPLALFYFAGVGERTTHVGEPIQQPDETRPTDLPAPPPYWVRTKLVRDAQKLLT
jgi:hypothetical protein